MAKKRTLFNTHLSEDQKIVRDITDFLKNEYKQYAKYVIATRAIPSIVDGFKVGARKIMWSALTGGAKNGKEIKNLKKELAQTKEELEILKKAIAIFTQK